MCRTRSEDSVSPLAAILSMESLVEIKLHSDAFEQVSRNSDFFKKILMQLMEA